MSNFPVNRIGLSVVTLLSLIAVWNTSQSEDASVAGVYSLVEVSGEPLPVDSWTETLDGERCKQVILKGVLLLDSEGRSAAYLLERVFCPGDTEGENQGVERSVIFPGSYSVSGNEITIEDDFGTDRAVLQGDILVYETGGEGRPVEKFVLKKE